MKYHQHQTVLWLKGEIAFFKDQFNLFSIILTVAIKVNRALVASLECHIAIVINSNFKCNDIISL